MTEHIAAQPASPEQQNQTPPVKRQNRFGANCYVV